MSASHGNTVAAWVAVAIILVGFVVGGAAVLMGSVALFWGGVIIAAGGGLAGKVLQMMGYGQAN